MISLTAGSIISIGVFFPYKEAALLKRAIAFSAISQISVSFVIPESLLTVAVKLALLLYDFAINPKLFNILSKVEILDWLSSELLSASVKSINIFSFSLSKSIKTLAE